MATPADEGGCGPAGYQNHPEAAVRPKPLLTEALKTQPHGKEATGHIPRPNFLLDTFDPLEIDEGFTWPKANISPPGKFTRQEELQQRMGNGADPFRHVIESRSEENEVRIPTHGLSSAIQSARPKVHPPVPTFPSPARVAVKDVSDEDLLATRRDDEGGPVGFKTTSPSSARRTATASVRRRPFPDPDRIDSLSSGRPSLISMPAAKPAAAHGSTYSSGFMGSGEANQTISNTLAMPSDRHLLGEGQASGTTQPDQPPLRAAAERRQNAQHSAVGTTVGQHEEFGRPTPTPARRAPTKLGGPFKQQSGFGKHAQHSSGSSNAAHYRNLVLQHNSDSVSNRGKFCQTPTAPGSPSRTSIRSCETRSSSDQFLQGYKVMKKRSDAKQRELRLRLTGQRQQIQALESELGLLNDRATQLASENDVLREDKEKMKGKLTERCTKLRERLNAAVKEQQDLYSRSCSASNDAINMVNRRIQALRAEKDDAVKRSEDCQSRLMATVKSVQEQRKRESHDKDLIIRQLRAEANSLNAELAEERRMIETLAKDQGQVQALEAIIKQQLGCQTASITSKLDECGIRYLLPLIQRGDVRDSKFGEAMKVLESVLSQSAVQGQNIEHIREICTGVASRVIPGIAQVTDSQARTEEAGRQLAADIRQIEEIWNENKGKGDAMTAALAELKEENALLATMVTEADEERQRVTEELAFWQQVAESHEGESRRLANELAEKSNMPLENPRTLAKLRAVQERSQVLRTELGEKNATITQLQQDLKARDKKHDEELKSMTDGKEDVLRDIEQQEVRLRRDYEEAIAKARAKFEAELNALRLKAETSAKELESTRSFLRDAEQALRGMQLKQSQDAEALQSLERKLDSQSQTSSRLAQARDRVAALETELADAESRASEATRVIAKRELELAQAQDLAKSQEGERNRVQSHLDEASQENAMEVAKLNKELGRDSNTIAILKKRINELERNKGPNPQISDLLSKAKGRVGELMTSLKLHVKHLLGENQANERRPGTPADASTLLQAMYDDLRLRMDELRLLYGVSLDDNSQVTQGGVSKTRAKPDEGLENADGDSGSSVDRGPHSTTESAFQETKHEEEQEGTGEKRAEQVADCKRISVQFSTDEADRSAQTITVQQEQSRRRVSNRPKSILKHQDGSQGSAQPVDGSEKQIDDDGQDKPPATRSTSRKRGFYDSEPLPSSQARGDRAAKRRKPVLMCIREAEPSGRVTASGI